MERKVRVRFAPSPTGPLHMGGVRTALFNYLFAKKHGGDFLLRIEDTDQNRFVPGAEAYIIEALKWCGLVPDEGVGFGGEMGPYRQSERKSVYKKYADALIKNGFAYYSFDSAEELDELRKQAEADKKVFSYDLHTRNKLKNSLTLSEKEVAAHLQSGEPYVIRFKMTENRVIVEEDLIRGSVSFNTNQLDDKVLFKSDGMPTYHLANVVDDHLMQITHVIRGEEWLPSLPLHIMLYRSFGWDAPLFAHLPLLLKPDGKGKLSKRDGDKMGFPVFPLYWPYGETAKGYREEGYYPEAFINMLALLGWNPGTEKEIFTMEELIDAFSIERVHKSGSRFDPEKAKWFNHHYLMERTNKQIAMEFRELLRTKGYHHDIGQIETLVGLVKERVCLVSEIWLETDFFFKSPETYDQDVIRKRWKPETPEQLLELKAVLSGIEDFRPAVTETTVKSWIEAKGYNTGTIMNGFRLVVVGASRGPHMFDIISWIGKEETLKRIDKGVSVIGKSV